LNSNHYIPEAAHLRNVIHSAWQVDGLTVFYHEHIIPKGVVEIIFNFTEGLPVLAQVSGQQCRLANCFINGFNTTPVSIQLPDRLRFFGIQLKPPAVKKILGIPAREFSDSVVDLALVDKIFDSLWHQLAGQGNFEERVSIFISWLEEKLPGWQSQEEMINHFLSSVGQHDLSVKELAGSLCYSTRQLSRKMIEATGMNTEEFLLYKKYLHAVHLIHHTDLSLTKIAYQSHFSDQSHFIKSFKTYTNMTPGEYRLNKGYVKGHIYENVR
jgi:AraC-like DNA-binding protein